MAYGIHLALKVTMKYVSCLFGFSCAAVYASASVSGLSSRIPWSQTPPRS